MNIGSFLRSLLLTALFYLPLPVLFGLLRKKPIRKKTVRWICIGFGAIIFILISALYVIRNVDGYPNIVAAVVWTWIGRAICCEIIEDRHLLADNEQSN